MCSRGVFQLKKLSLYFCDYGGSSAGVRQIISSPKITDFLSANPQIQLQAICKRNNHPFVRGAYINGYTKQVPLRDYTDEQVLQSLKELRNQLGRKSFKVTGSRVYSTKKSIQGKWQPNLFNTYPIGQLSKAHKIPDVPTSKVEVEDPQRNVRKRDVLGTQTKVRHFVDPHRQF